MTFKSALSVSLIALMLTGCVATTQQQVVPTTTAPEASGTTSGNTGSGSVQTPQGTATPTPAKQSRSREDQELGDNQHPMIIAEFGEFRDPELQAYVEGIGRKLVAKTPQAHEEWTFTLLDSAEVNAFALPGGYVYVTRGLLALANDEAELAGVIGHEIGHVIAEHGSRRKKKEELASIRVLGAAILGGIIAGQDGAQLGADLMGTVGQGQVAQYSQQQEFEADQLGIQYISYSGYDPLAQADFLDHLAAQSALQAKLAGQEYDPDKVSFFASHPATGDRVRQAIAQASLTGAVGTARLKSQYLSQIDGLPFGDSIDEGVVRGQTFTHPDLRMGFTAPQGFQIFNSTERVVLKGPLDSEILFDGSAAEGDTPAQFLREAWYPWLAENVEVGSLRNVERTTINGLTAVTGTLAMRIEGVVHDTHLTVIEYGNTLYRYHAMVPRSAGPELLKTAASAARSFHILSQAEVDAIQPLQIKIHQVQAGDTIANLAARMEETPLPEDSFKVLNGFKQGQAPKVGSQVKLVQ